MRLPRRPVRRLALLLALVASFAAVVGAQPHNQFAGFVVFEAEGFSANIPRGAHAWTETAAIADFSGTGAMQATPNTGANIDASWETTSPELQYVVNFTSTGTHYVWVRGFAADDMADSVHVGLDGGGTSAARIALSALNEWQWTNTVFGTGVAATINVPSTGQHTVNVWMREDGFAFDRLALSTKPDFTAETGNAWHIPINGELGGIASMRAPYLEIGAGTDVEFVNGNQFQGAGGNPGNQLQTGSAVLWRVNGAPTWNVLPLLFLLESGNNKYFSGTLAGSSFAAGDLVEYYLRIPYDTHLPTFLHGDDDSSMKSENENVARANPFGFTVQGPLAATGKFASIADGAFEGRIYLATGHIELVGPPLRGGDAESVVTLAPSGARLANYTAYIGLVSTTTPDGAGGLDIVQFVDGREIASRLFFAAPGILRYEVTDWDGAAPAETSLRAASPADEHFYGFGEKFNTFDQAGKRVNMLAYDEPGNKDDRAYKVAPWFASTRGYGFRLDSSAESTFDMRAEVADRYAVVNPHSRLAVELVGGPRLTEVVSRFTARTGRPPAPPEWAFGVWMSTDHWRTGGEVRYAIERSVALGIPLSVIVFDSPWEIAYNDFTWNMTQFGNAGTYESVNYPGFASVEAMMQFIRAHGVKVVCWMTPFVNITSNNEGVPGANMGQAANYAEGAANNYFVRASEGGPPLLANWWKGRGSPVDFTNPAATEWIWDQLRALITQSTVQTPSGATATVIGGFKTDDGEAEGGANVYIPESAVYFDGRTGVEMRNGYSLEYHRAIWNVLADDGILFARSGFTGSQAYPAGWSGDNEPNFGPNGLPSVVVAGQTAAMSGIAMWSHDVGGYIDGNYSVNPGDLFRRWAQFGALTPLMQMHRQVGTGRQYPWSYDTSSTSPLDNYRACAELHSRLFPYIYSYAAEVVTTGLPIIRPLVLLHQDDPNVWGINHTYYFGDELLVAPVVTVNTTQRDVYLPAGTWHDWWTGAAHGGGQVVSWSNADVMTFPLFVREGAFVPMLATAPQSMCPPEYVDNPAISTRTDDLDVRVYPAAAVGVSGAFGFSLWEGTSFTAERIEADVIRVAMAGGARAMQYRILAPAPAAVARDGATIPMAATAGEYDAAETAWRHDAASGFVLVKFAHTGGATTVVLNPPAQPPGSKAVVY